jgi:G:T-mismatch repair DNA endonuclease (very short patch repair protein)
MMPRTNRLFWEQKRHRNAQRDQRVVTELERAGYTVLIIWGCHASQLAYVAASITQLLTSATLRGRGTVRETVRDRRTNKIVLRVKRGA